LGRYTGLGIPNTETIEAIKVDLTRNIAKVLSDIQDEIVYACDREIGECPAWTEVPVYDKVLQLVALLSGRTFVGLPLSRDKEWTDATINFTSDTLRAVKAIEKYHPLIRPLISHLLPEVKGLRAYREFAGEKLKPQVDAILIRRLEKENGHMPEDLLDDDVVKGDFNMIHWTLNHLKDINSADAILLGQLQMLIAFAAIHTTSMALSHAIFDLAAHPQYIAELQEEIEKVIADENYPDKMLRKTSMPKLRKLDSFIKESQRVSPLGMSKLKLVYFPFCEVIS
jgi:gliotoxin biosynthesis cytochrome P450 monooxygenase